MKSKLTACSACGAEMAKSAKACPHCGAKNKKPIFKKWWFWVIAVVLAAAIGGSGGGDTPAPSGSGGTVSSAPAGSGTAAGSSSSAPVEISYAHYDVTDLFDELNSNALKAEKTFKGQYVELEGYVSNIDSSGKYIGIGAAPDNYDYFLASIQCYIKNDAQLEKVLEVNVGDSITIRGKIRTVGEVMGYSLDIDSIG